MVEDRCGLISVRWVYVELLVDLRHLGRVALYDVVSGDSGGLGYSAVPGTEEECRQWQDAAGAYRKAVTEAAERLGEEESGPWWLRWLPGRADRARKRFEERFDAACEEYRPVTEVIQQRLHLQREERLRRQEQMYRATVERCQPLAERAVWKWIQVRPAVVYVFRHDVPPAHALPSGYRQAVEPLNAADLLTALADLVEGGVARIDWDANARKAVEDECSVPGDRVSNGRWWIVITKGQWPQLNRHPSHLNGFPSPAGVNSTERSWGWPYAGGYDGHYYDDGYRASGAHGGHHSGGYHSSYGNPFGGIF
ncbi:hypothetical protein ABZ876_37160 [Streptomyces sp. NPDC046931]|uniref:hypothetical protein n=1 Tax=Streptomyces sp. NPDC046931 TaxID=3154806 RepID=UPI0033EFA260